jgi:hypothetical protein
MHAQLRGETARRLERRRERARRVAEREVAEGREEVERGRREDEARWSRLMGMREAERVKLQEKVADRKQQRAVAVLNELARRELAAARRAVAAVALQSAARRWLAVADARKRRNNQLQLHFCAHQACWVARARAAASPEAAEGEEEAQLGCRDHASL